MKCGEMRKAAILVGLALMVAPAAAAVLVVDGKNPAAKDDNAGTAEAPLKTIQAAVDRAEPGDTVSLRAGVYHESVKLKRSGTCYGSLVRMEPDRVKWITIEAAGDERVVLDGSAEIPGDRWRLVEGKTNTYVGPFACKGWQKALQMVWAGDALIMPSLAPNPDKNQPDRPLLPTMPGDRPADRGWFYDKEKDLLYLNLGGGAPGRDGAVRASELDGCIDGANQSYFRVRKLEIRGYCQQGVIVYNSHEFVVEDNLIHHVGTGMWGSPSSGGVIRRNTFSDIMHMGMGMHAAMGGIIEGNLFRRFNINPYKTLDYAASIMCNGANGLVIRNNVITENISDCVGGPWPDCSAMGLGIYGNTCYGLSGHGFYIEAGAYATCLRWNCAFDNAFGITFRQNAMNTAVENYVFRNRLAGLAISSTDAIQPRPVGNTMMYNWVIDNRQGASTGPDRNGEMAQAFDHNTYRVPADGLLFGYGDKQYKALDALRAEVGEEMHGKVVTDFDPAPLGLVTFRVPGSKRPWEPVPMFGNPDCSRFDVLSNYPDAYFWRRGTFEEEKADGWRGVRVTDVSGGVWTWGNTQGVVRQMDTSGIAYVKAYPGGVLNAALDDPKAARGDALCMQAAAMPGKTVSAEGVGFWGANLPTVDDAEIVVDLWLKASGVKAEGDGGGVYVFVDFCDATGQNHSRQYIVGGPGGKRMRPELATGTYEMTEAGEVVKAPAGARWLRLAYGLRSCEGVVSFDDLSVNTRPGQAPEQLEAKAPVDAAAYAWQPVDLKGLLNRTLADEVDGDGKGGWTDQGPQADLRNLHAGEHTYGGVRFKVAEGKACFIMRSPRRPAGNLPERGVVKIGARADALAFLHSGGWIAGDVQHARYVIHYADGSKVEIPLVGGRNILDWTAPAEAPTGAAYDPALGYTRAAVSVPSHRFVTVHVWMTLWVNPHPEKAIASLEIVGANQGIPGLIAVSRGAARK